MAPLIRSPRQSSCFHATPRRLGVLLTRPSRTFRQPNGRSALLLSLKRPRSGFVVCAEWMTWVFVTLVSPLPYFHAVWRKTSYCLNPSMNLPCIFHASSMHLPCTSMHPSFTSMHLHSPPMHLYASSMHPPCIPMHRLIRLIPFHYPLNASTQPRVV